MSSAECLVHSERFTALINNAGDVERQGLYIALRGSHADRKAQRALRKQNTLTLFCPKYANLSLAQVKQCICKAHNRVLGCTEEQRLPYRALEEDPVQQVAK